MWASFWRIKPHRRRLLILSTLLAAGLLAGWRPALSFAGRFLVCSGTPQPADLILVLAGDFYGSRVLKAAELAKQGFAPRVLISGTPYQTGMEGDFAIAFLARHGYPTRLFESFGHHARSTIEEARVLHTELVRRNTRRVILVTSSFHSRRSAIVFALFCPEVDFISVPSDEKNFHPAVWWRDESSRALVFSEWGKIIGTVLVEYPMDRLERLFGIEP